MLAGMSRSRVAFVVTLSAAGALSCAEPPLRANPPGPELPRPDAAAPDAAAPEGEEPAAPEPARVDDAAAPVEPGVLNPRDAENRTVFRDNGERCYVELPFPPLKPGEQRPPGSAPPTRNVACPAEILDPAFAECRGGALERQPSGECTCFVMGNPPPPPRPVPCPKR